MAKWSMNLDEWVQKNKQTVKEVRKEFANACYSSIVKKTPVDTGRARGNWQIDIPADDDGTITISNNLEYAPVLEFGGYGKWETDENGNKTRFIPANGEKTINGYSKQAPNGMVGVTLANADNLLQSAIETAKHKTQN